MKYKKVCNPILMKLYINTLINRPSDLLLHGSWPSLLFCLHQYWWKMVIIQYFNIYDHFLRIICMLQVTQTELEILSDSIFKLMSSPYMMADRVERFCKQLDQLHCCILKFSLCVQCQHVKLLNLKVNSPMDIVSSVLCWDTCSTLMLLKFESENKMFKLSLILLSLFCFKFVQV